MKTKHTPFGDVQLLVPVDMGDSFHTGDWKDEADFYGPIVADLNSDIDIDDIKSEIRNLGIDPGKTDDEAWKYTSWIVAGNLRDAQTDQRLSSA